MSIVDGKYVDQANQSGNVPALPGLPGVQAPGGGGSASANYKKNTVQIYEQLNWGKQNTTFEAYNPNRLWIKGHGKAPIKRMRLWILSRENKISSGWRAAIAPTDKPISMSDTINNAFVPQRGGTLYNADASYSVPYGWRTFGWSGNDDYGPRGIRNYIKATSSPILYHAGDNRPNNDASKPNHATWNFVKTDWLPFNSVAASDGSGVYPFLLKAYRVAGAGENASARSLSAAQLQAAVTAAQAPMFISSANDNTGDFIADHTKVPTGLPNMGVSTANIPVFLLEIDYGIPVRQIIAPGESHYEGFMIPSNELTDRSTAAAPLSWSNWGQSSCRSAEYFNTIENFVKAGLNFSDIVLPSHSTNDQLVQFSYDNLSHYLASALSVLSRNIDEYQALGKRVWVMPMFYMKGQDDSGPWNNPHYAAFIANVIALANAKGCALIDMSTDFNPLIHMSTDHTHLSNPAGIALFRTKLDGTLATELV